MKRAFPEQLLPDTDTIKLKLSAIENLVQKHLDTGDPSCSIIREIRRVLSSSSSPGTNYYDRLPNELLVKIFRYVFAADTSRDSSRDEIWIGSPYTIMDLNNLCMTCKRIQYITYNELLANIRFAKLASLSIRAQDRPHPFKPPVYKPMDWDQVVRHYGDGLKERQNLYYEVEQQDQYDGDCSSIWNYTEFKLGRLRPLVQFDGNDNGVYNEFGFRRVLYTRSLRKYDFEVKNKPPFWCDYTDEDDCSCLSVRTLLERCSVKCRFLALISVDLSRNCIQKFIEDKAAQLDSVIQLTLDESVIETAELDNILKGLPKLERLSIRLKEQVIEGRDIFLDGKILYNNSSHRTLNYLYFYSNDYIDGRLINPFANLPAKLVDCELWASKENLCLVRHYLIRYKSIIEQFRFRLQGRRQKGWTKFFKGFDVTCVYLDYGCVEITSSSCSNLNLDTMMM